MIGSGSQNMVIGPTSISVTWELDRNAYFLDCHPRPNESETLEHGDWKYVLTNRPGDSGTC